MSNPFQPTPNAPWQYVVRKAIIAEGTAIYDPQFTARRTETVAATDDKASHLYVCGVVLNGEGNIVQTLTAQSPRGDANEFRPVFQITTSTRHVLGNERLHLTQNQLEKPVSVEAFLATEVTPDVKRRPDVNISGHLVTALQELEKTPAMMDQILSGGIAPGPGAGRAAPAY